MIKTQKTSFALLFVCMLTGCVTTPPTDPAVSQSKLETYSSPGGVLDQIIEKNAQRSRSQLACKPQVYTLKNAGYEPLINVDFPEDYEHPRSGGWFQFYDVNLCGDKLKMKYLVKAQDGKPPRLFPYLPGNSEASPQLQRDASRIALSSTMINAGLKPKCSRAQIINTKFVEKKLDGSWIEDWTVNYCSKHLIGITFTPSGNSGTAINSSYRGIKK